MSAAPRRILVFTGDRADFGPLGPVARAVSEHPGLELRLVVGGDHLEAVEAAGFPVAAHVPVRRTSEVRTSTAEAVGEAMPRLANAFIALEPDVVVLYADRFETLAAGLAAAQSGLLCAHLEGGDRTEGGTLDDAARRTLTAFCHLHFPTNPDAAARLRALGEEPWRIHEIGLPSLDGVADGELASTDELTETLGFDPGRPFILFTQHPVSLTAEAAGEEIAASLAACEDLMAEGVRVIATHPNRDHGRDAIVTALEAAAAAHPESLRLVPSLGRRRYHGLLALANGAGRGVCAGNSSSGIKEAGAFDCPVVDIGERQSGRLHGANVLHVVGERDAIAAALRRALFDEAWRASCHRATHPYGRGDAGRRCARLLAEIPLDDRLRWKRWTV